MMVRVQSPMGSLNVIAGFCVSTCYFQLVEGLASRTKEGTNEQWSCQLSKPIETKATSLGLYGIFWP